MPLVNEFGELDLLNLTWDVGAVQLQRIGLARDPPCALLTQLSLDPAF
jgi:hypothetical protein